MNPTLITVMQNDYGYNLNFTLQDSQGNVFDLTNNTGVLFRVQIAGLSILLFSNSIVVDTAASGTCHYTVGQTDFTTSGTYDAEIQVSFASKVVTFDNITVTVIPKVPHS